MPNEVNLLDPLGIANAVRGQVNQMAAQAKLPQLPILPTVSVKGLPFPNRIPDRPGMSRPDRAG